jgi:hypothetical protein
MCHNAIDKEPLNYWLWHELCTYYVSKNDLNGAIQACIVGAEKSATNPSPLMALSNLYAAKGEFMAAADSSAKLYAIQPTSIRLALRAATQYPLKPCEMNLKNSLERLVTLNHLN